MTDKLELHVYFHADESTARFQTAVLNQLGLIHNQGVTLMSQQDDLKAALAEEDKDIDQVLSLLSGQIATIADLQAQLAAAIAAGSPDLSALITGVQAKTAELVKVLPPPTPPPTP